jgi:hypothetical protein
MKRTASIAPTPTLILTGQRSVAHILDVTAMGRVTPAGEFHDHEAVIDLVTSLDLSILNLGAAVNPHSVAEQEQNIQGTCAVLTGLVAGQAATCGATYPGSTPQEQFGACVAFMHTIPYGTWDRANSNTAVCRQLHTLLTPFRPAIHCPHAGPTGGDACIDFTYESFLDHEF